METKNKIRVVVAMSGGVDSSVAAYLLKEEGYDVIGVSLKVWDECSTVKKTKTCCSFEDINDARRVCDRLKVPFYAFNYKKEFHEKVITRFVDEYERGRTPNPCILCNNHIKFEQLLIEAEKLGAGYLATGHHARIKKDEQGTYHLLKGVDDHKDQSYVLSRLGQDQLKKILFPVGEYTKEEIREVARQNKVPTADKAESQDICFIPNRDHESFIRNNFPDKIKGEGKFVDKDGKILGSHVGIHRYTVGQRRGLGIGFGDRMYVIKINADKNEVVLGEKENLFVEGLVAHEVSWIKNDMESGGRIECGVKVRYQKNEIPCVVERGEMSDQVIVRFAEKRPSVAPGQAAVFYLGNEVIGGGWIERSL